MSNLKKSVFAVTFGLLILFAATIYLPSAKTMWIRHSGAVIPNGSSEQVYTDKPFRILSVTGQRWVGGRLLEASAYHALVIFPTVIPKDHDSSSEGKNAFTQTDINKWSVPFTDDHGGSRAGGDGFTHTDINQWWVPTPGRSADSQGFDLRELEITYDALWQTITLNAHTYHLAKGNLFVIRFDRSSSPAVTQLNVTLNTRAEVDEQVNAFKAALKDDPSIQQL